MEGGRVVKRYPIDGSHCGIGRRRRRDHVEVLTRRIQTDAVRAERNETAAVECRVLKPNRRRTAAGRVAKDRGLQRIGDISIAGVVKYNVIRNRWKIGRKRKLSTPTFDTTIYFTVRHQRNGNVIIVCRDYGIGMDEHVIRNYFAVAGVSYYRSSEFERQQLGFEPISRFGIGVLSCFMGANKLSVKTYRDPESGPPMAQADSILPSSEEYRARRLSLDIPAIDRQFIVRELVDEFAGVIEPGKQVPGEDQRYRGKDRQRR